MTTTGTLADAALVILNGKETGNEDVREAILERRAAGHRIDVRVTWEEDDAARFVEQATREGYGTLVAAGGDLRFGVVGLDRKHWSSAGPIRTIFKEAFTAAGLDYFNPHSFRKTLAVLGEQRCKTPEEWKAWSQNLGHEDVLTTFRSYGDVSSHRQAEIMRSFASPA